MIVISVFLLKILTNVRNDTNREFLSLLSYLLANGVPLVLVLFFYKKKLPFGLINHYFKLTIISIIVILGLHISVIQPLALSIPIPNSIKEILLQSSKKIGFITIFTVIVIAPIIEEFIFRGVILNGFLKNGLKPKFGIIISTILFSFFHLNPWQIPTSFCTGILLGWVFFKTRNVLISILIHFTNNLLGYIAMFFLDLNKMVNENSIDFYGGPFSFSLIVTIFLIVTIWGLILLNKQLELEQKLIN